VAPGAPHARTEEASVYDAFENTRRRCGARPFLHIPAHCAGGLVDLTYEEAGVAIERTIAGYRLAGYGPGHHIALLLDNRAEFYIHWLALNAIGAVIVPIGMGLAPQEATFLLQHGNADLLVHLPERREAAERAAHPIDGLPMATPQAVDALDAPRASSRRVVEGSLGMAAIIFTSGSTGRPKGCVLSNEYFLTFGCWYRDLGGRCALRAELERLITPLPLNHVNALAFSSMGMILTGGCIIQLDRFRSSEWWSTVAESRATLMHYLGVMPAMLLQLPRHPRERSHALRFGFGGGVRGAHHALFEARYGIPLIEAWAMTETGGAGTISTHVGERHVGSGCIGQPHARYAEARVVDDEGRTQVVDAVGELMVRAAGDDPRRGFFSGYYQDPPATEAAWQHGWLHTGDLARRGADGAFFFVGRRKQMIRRSGENISAAEVEGVLGADARVKDVAVVPVPDEIREEEVFACIVAHLEVVPTRAVADDILRTAAERLAYFKLPGYVAFLDSLPVTATQKPRYGALAELAQSLLAAPTTLLFDLRHAKRDYGPARP
jgi:acyl-CoA synthetase (AMP-forming)/AMP-acid ligase II